MTLPADQDYDVFVSYAHADNDVPLGSAMPVGWVTALAENLNTGPNVLKKRLFIDHQLKPGDPFSTDLLSKVERSAVLVLLLSQNYVKSPWCGKEVEHFIRSHADDPDKPSGVFVVELWPYDSLPTLPPAIQLLRKRLIASKFWFKAADAASPSLAGYPSPLECRAEGRELYWRVLNELQAAVDARLGELRTAAPPAPAPGPAKGSLGTVLLADTTEDLEAQRNKVKAMLEPEGVLVLPEGDYVGLTQPEFDTAVAGDLAQADLFVQLLSPTAGRKGRLDLPLPQLQYRRAMAASKPVLQWAARQPEPDDIADAGHAQLFDTATLRATHLTEFTNDVIGWLRAEKSRRERELEEQRQRAASNFSSTTPGPLVTQAARRRHIFIDDVAGEPALSKRVREIIKDQNYAWRSGQPPNVDIQEWLRPCVAGLTIYTDTSKRQIAQSRLIHFLNQVADGKVDMQRWGVFLQSGTVASEFGFEAEGLMDVNEQGLAEFLRGIGH
jgi:hypothetical protein